MANAQPAHDRNTNPKTEIEEFKEFLGRIASRYSDAQLVQLRSDMHAAARLLLELYLLKKAPGVKRLKSFDNQQMET